MTIQRFVLAALLLTPLFIFAGEKIDTSAINKIADEGMNRSQVMDILSWITDVHGPRLTGSPEYKRAAAWAREKFASWGADAHMEGWGPFGRAWTLQRYTAHVTSPATFPLISFPRAWSPGTDGVEKGEVIDFSAVTESTLATFKGKLKGKFVLMSAMENTKAGFDPRATRLTDKELLELANKSSETRQRRFRAASGATPSALFAFKKMEMCQKEGAIALLTASRGDGGNVFVQQASVPYHPDVPRDKRKAVYEEKAPETLTQIQVGAEHYNRLHRMLARGQRVTLEIGLDVKFGKVDSGYNIIAEIPGTDLKDEVVMIGAHFDSWHGGSGATDNGAGSATVMEAIRILKATGLQPRRTIRAALWGGEEQGLMGSRAYAERHLGRQVSKPGDSSYTIELTPQGEKFSVYFNMDNGTGKFRGVYMEGNEAARPIFRSWLETFEPQGASTLSMSGTGGTDHGSFNRIGLPGFQFIQDGIEYFTMTWHSTMDLYERALSEDLKQTSVIMATFAYNAAVRDERIPRKPSPVVTESAGAGMLIEQDEDED